METMLGTLRREGILKDWSDSKILPGRHVSATIERNFPDFDIFAFLLSPDFLDSDECLKEWTRAKEIVASGRLAFRVPIIVRNCPWRRFLGEDDLKALPNDGRPIIDFENPDAAWLEVYEGIERVVEALRSTHTPRPAFLDELTGHDFE